MLSKKELEAFDTPCQYIAGKKVVCEVVKSHIEALHAKDRELLKEVVRQVEETKRRGIQVNWMFIGMDKVVEILRSLIEGKEEL